MNNGDTIQLGKSTYTVALGGGTCIATLIGKRGGESVIVRNAKTSTLWGHVAGARTDWYARAADGTFTAVRM